MIRCETETQSIKTYASEKNNEAKADYLSATAGEQADKLSIQTHENAFKGNDKFKQVVDQFKH